MANFEISISKEKVLEEVSRTTAYAGSKSNGTLDFKKVATTKGDNNMTALFWTEAAGIILSLCRRFIASHVSEDENSDSNFDITLDMPANFNTSQKKSIIAEIFSFFVSYIVSRWLKFSDKSEASDYMNEALNRIGSVREKLFQRIKPSRKADSENK